jgi:hypothetical protein
MSSVKRTTLFGLAAIALAGCGTGTKPLAGTRNSSGRVVAGRGVVDDPRTKHLNCMKRHGLQAVAVGQTSIQVDAPPSGPRIDFAPTAGAAQQDQISGQIQGAEVIGSALLYPAQASDKELKELEDCLAEGVTG